MLSLCTGAVNLCCVGSRRDVAPWWGMVGWGGVGRELDCGSEQMGGCWETECDDETREREEKQERRWGVIIQYSSGGGLFRGGDSVRSGGDVAQCTHGPVAAYSSPTAQRLAALASPWVALLCLSLARFGEPWRARSLEKGQDSNRAL
jgi:hypothetical protein